MMKNLILLILCSFSFNICDGQSEQLFARNPQRLNTHHELPNQISPKNRVLFGDVNERLDSAWTRTFNFDQNEWYTSRIAYYTYTDEHLLASETYRDVEQDGDPYQRSQEEYFYNDQGLCTLHYTNHIRPGSGEWSRGNREEVAYNEDSLIEEYSISAWDTAVTQFVYSSKFISTYTPSNLQDEIISYIWEDDDWKLYSRSKYEYNSAASILAINTFRWNEVTEEYQLQYKIENFYTNDTHLDSIIDSWDMGAGLELFSKIILMTNEQGLVESDIYYEWSGNSWEPNALTEYAYTPQGKETLNTYYEWDEDEQRFVEDVYEENTFTAAGDPKRYTYAEYDTETETWIPWESSEIFYDENVDGSTIVWPNPAFYEPATFHQKPIFEVSSSFYIDTWYVEDTTILFYGNLTTPTIPVSKLNVNVYPNPTCDQLTIQMEHLRPDATITFFDQQGKFAAARPLQSNVPVSISGLVPGGYVYRIRNGTEFYSGKVLKE